jgi:hypothetical protein
MKRAVFFAIVAALVLVPCGVAYGYGHVNAANIQASVQPADDASKPIIRVFGNAVGSVTPGALFTIDNSGTTTDKSFTLLMTNIDELTHFYRFFTLKVGIRVQTGVNTWEKITGDPAMYLTMQGGSVGFTLSGNATYKVTIESGSFGAYPIAKGQDVAIPQFCINGS